MPANLFAVLSLLVVTAPSLSPSPSSSSVQRPWTPTSEMVQWADDYVPDSGSLHRRAGALHDALVARRGLVDSRKIALSQTAEEAFVGRSVDCVGFAYLYLGLARQLGLPAYFVMHDARAVAGQVLGARLEERHLAVGLWDGYDELVVDFSGLHRHDEFRFLEDDEAEAILWSNRGVRAAFEEDCPGAVTSLQRAVQLTSDTDVARNLAVVSSRCSQ